MASDPLHALVGRDTVILTKVVFDQVVGAGTPINLFVPSLVGSGYLTGLRIGLGIAVADIVGGRRILAWISTLEPERSMPVADALELKVAEYLAALRDDR